MKLGIIEINNLYWNTLGAVQLFLPWGPSQPTSDDCVRIETPATPTASRSRRRAGGRGGGVGSFIDTPPPGLGRPPV